MVEALFVAGIVLFALAGVVTVVHETWISRRWRLWLSAQDCDKYVASDSVFSDLDGHLVHVISKTRTAAEDVVASGAAGSHSQAQSEAAAAAVFVPVADASGADAKAATTTATPTVSGASAAHAPLTDPDLHLPFPDCVRFKRIVEMYQWQKAPHTHTGYEGVWSSDFIDSRRFAREFQNVSVDKRPPLVSLEMSAPVVHLGSAFRLSPALVRMMTWWQPRVLQEADHSRIHPLWQEKLSFQGKYLFMGRGSASEPQIGDIRISFLHIRNCDVSVMAAQHADTFRPWTGDGCACCFDVFCGGFCVRPSAEPNTAPLTFVPFISSGPSSHAQTQHSQTQMSVTRDLSAVSSLAGLTPSAPGTTTALTHVTTGSAPASGNTARTISEQDVTVTLLDKDKDKDKDGKSALAVNVDATPPGKTRAIFHVTTSGPGHLTLPRGHTLGAALQQGLGLDTVQPSPLPSPFVTPLPSPRATDSLLGKDAESHDGDGWESRDKDKQKDKQKSKEKDLSPQPKSEAFFHGPLPTATTTTAPVAVSANGDRSSLSTAQQHKLSSSERPSGTGASLNASVLDADVLMDQGLDPELAMDKALHSTNAPAHADILRQISGKNAYSILWINQHSVSAERMIEQRRPQRSFWPYVVRLLCFGLMFVGLGLLFSSLSANSLSSLPYMGTVALKNNAWIAAILTTLPVFVGLSSLVWYSAHPLRALPLTIASAAAILLVIFLA